MQIYIFKHAYNVVLFSTFKSPPSNKPRLWAGTSQVSAGSSEMPPANGGSAAATGHGEASLSWRN